jgi:DNA-binding MarR family transcriptional regulator
VAATRWLDEREQAAWRGFLAMQTQVGGRLRRLLQQQSGLSDADYDVLVHLSEADRGQLRIFALGQALLWEKSRLSHQLRRMAERGLVVREECDTDGRGAFVRLTPAGRRVIRAAAPRHVAEVRRTFVDVLSPAQLDALAAMAAVVLAHLDADDAGDPSRCSVDRRVDRAGRHAVR